MKHNFLTPRRVGPVVVIALIAVLLLPAFRFVGGVAVAAPSSQDVPVSRYFAATQHYLAANFQAQYDSMGGSDRFGAPMTEPWTENGVTYQVFQNARLEQAAGGPVTITALGSMAVAGRSADAPVNVGPDGVNGQYFMETGHTVSAPFLDHWLKTNGWSRLGLPITDVIDMNDVQIQYFQFASLSTNDSSPDGIREQFQDNQRAAGSPFAPINAPTDQSVVFFTSTGHSVGGGFLEVYNKIGGASSLGAPLTEEMTENAIRVQYFELGKLEYHVDAPAGQQVVVTPLGTQWLAGSTVPADALQIQVEPTVTVAPTETATATATTQPSPTVAPTSTAAPASVKGVPAGWHEIARGSTKFAGSSAARMTNVRIAAQKIDGSITPAGATFSFNKTLGDDTEKSGFVEALVIYNGHTVEGIGGGICQVSSTVFRSAFYAGFDIVARKNHSYRVSWYEPPVGFDATVFSDEGLDLKWRNNLGAPVLLKTYFNGNAGTLDVVLYSTASPKYNISLDGPYTSNPVAHGAALYEDDPSLAKGTVKQVEVAKDGLDAVIKRVFTDKTTGKVVSTQSFSSHYVPWRAVFKRGTGGSGPSSPTVQKP